MGPKLTLDLLMTNSSFMMQYRFNNNSLIIDDSKLTLYYTKLYG